ncbi:MAG TPA: hypothetical protein VG847_08505 [Chitinophagaceae bacterium]|nr:hypothetical protein [Chitinophagaceae bacterium]
MKLHPGRYVFGLAAIVFGITGLVWMDFNTWQQVRSLGHLSHPKMLAAILAAIELIGGIAMQWQKTLRFGAIILCIIYLLFALLWVPFIIQTPLAYDSWGNFFEQFSMAAGAWVAYFSFEGGNPSARKARIGCILFGICVLSFTLEQVFYLSATAGFVPAWMPPGQMFWAVATTILLALAAIAILTGRLALLAVRLLTIMIICFGLLIWLPVLINDPGKLFNWAGNAENLGIAGAAWIVAEYLAESKTAGSNRYPN